MVAPPRSRYVGSPAEIGNQTQAARGFLCPRQTSVRRLEIEIEIEIGHWSLVIGHWSYEPRTDRRTDRLTNLSILIYATPLFADRLASSILRVLTE